jgi:hypothetical protein
MSARRKSVELQLPDPDRGPPPLPPGFPRWKHFGWDGWQVQIPVDWDLGALDVSPRGGYFRLDDEFEPRLVVRWQPVKGDFDPEKAIERHFKKNYPRLSAADGGPVPRIGASLPGLSKTFRELQYQTYSLDLDEVRSMGLAAHCPKCSRAFVAELTAAPKGGAGDRLAKRVLGSLSEHSSGRLNRWEFFGLSFDLPSTLQAASHRFNQGYVSLAATEPRRRVELSRWTLANMHLAGRDLEKFLNLHFLKKRNVPPMITAAVSVNSHPGVHFHNRQRMLEPARAVFRKSLRVRNPAYRTGLLWHCEQSNRIIMVQLGSNRANDIGAARLIASRVRCCKVIH